MRRLAALSLAPTLVVCALAVLTPAPGYAASRSLVLLTESQEAKVVRNGSRIWAFVELSVPGAECSADEREATLVSNATSKPTVTSGPGDVRDTCTTTGPSLSGVLAEMRFTGSGKFVAKAHPALRLGISGCSYQFTKLETTFAPPAPLSNGAKAIHGIAEGKRVAPSPSGACPSPLNANFAVELWEMVPLEPGAWSFQPLVLEAP
jgi:hypothetical protein